MALHKEDKVPRSTVPTRVRTRTMTFDLSEPGLYVPVYLPLFEDKKRTKIIYGSRSSAKSQFACQRMLVKCLGSKPGKFKCLMVRKMKEDVRESIYETLKDIITEWGLTPYFRFLESRASIQCSINGNWFLPKGMYETLGKSGNAKSIRKPTDAIVDEADELTYLEYIKLSGSLRGSDAIEEYLIMNPPTADHWIVKYFFPEDKESFEKPDGTHTWVPSTVPTCTILHTTYKMNPFLSNSDRGFFRALETQNPDLYKIDGLGLLRETRTGGEALKKFDRAKHVTDEPLFDPSRRALECWDFNRRPHHTVSLWQFWHDAAAGVFRADLVHEVCEPDASVREVQQLVNDWLKANGYQPRAVRLVADHSGTKEMDSDAVTQIAKIIREATREGFEVLNETSPNPGVVSSLDFLNDMFGGHVYLDEQSNYPNTPVAIRVYSGCTFHVADFAKTKLDKDGKLLKVTRREMVRDGDEQKAVVYQTRGHGVDNARYMAVGVFENEYKKFLRRD